MIKSLTVVFVFYLLNHYQMVNKVFFLSMVSHKNVISLVF